MPASFRAGTTIEHGGTTVGYISDLVVAPDQRVGIVVLTNATNGAAVTQAVRRTMLAELLGVVESDPVPDPDAEGMDIREWQMEPGDAVAELERWEDAWTAEHLDATGHLGHGRGAVAGALEAFHGVGGLGGRRGGEPEARGLDEGAERGGAGVVQLEGELGAAVARVAGTDGAAIDAGSHEAARAGECGGAAEHAGEEGLLAGGDDPGFVGRGRRGGEQEREDGRGQQAGGVARGAGRGGRHAQ